METRCDLDSSWISATVAIRSYTTASPPPDESLGPAPPLPPSSVGVTTTWPSASKDMVTENGTQWSCTSASASSPAGSPAAQADDDPVPVTVASCDQNAFSSSVVGEALTTSTSGIVRISFRWIYK